MATEANQFKQNLSMNSQRVMERKVSLFSRQKSFSDSDVVESEEYRKESYTLQTKCKSESHLGMDLEKDIMSNISAKSSQIRNSTHNFPIPSPVSAALLGVHENKNAALKSFYPSGIPPRNESANTEIIPTSPPFVSDSIDNKNEQVVVENSILSQNMVPCVGCIENPSNLNNQKQILVAELRDKNISAISANIPTTESVSATPKISNPYRVMENAVQNKNIIGEPRCLTLKNQSSDVNPFLTDDSLIFDLDFEDDQRNLGSRFSRTESKLTSRISDMFVDEDEIKTLKKLSSHDREEGELSPDLHSTPSDALAKKPDVSAKLNAEFFSKLNEYLRDIDKKCREFHTSSVSEHHLKHLQLTLNNIDNIKRKLSFLVKSKNADIKQKMEIKKNSEKYSNLRNRSKLSSLKNDSRLKDSSNLNKSTNRHANSKENSKEYNSETKENAESLYFQKGEGHQRRELESNSSHAHRSRRRSSRDKPSQTDLLNRKKVNILEKLGTKQEIQRIQSLFKRQMNLIAQHVIQAGKTHREGSEKSRRRHSSHKQENKNLRIRENINLSNLNTLDDMEAFLDVLKKKSDEKVMSERYLMDEKKRGSLKFTSKKERPPKLNVQHNEPESPKTPVKVPNKNLNTETFKKPFDKENAVEATQKRDHKEIKQKELEKEKDAKSRNDSLRENHSRANDERLKLVNKNTSTKSNSKNEIYDQLQFNNNQKSDKISHEILQKDHVLSKKNKNIYPPKTMEFESVPRVSGDAKQLQSSKPNESEDVSQMNPQKSIKRKRNEMCENKSPDLESEDDKLILESHKTRKQRHISPKRLKYDDVEGKEMSMKQSYSKHRQRHEKFSNSSHKTLIQNFLSKKIVILDDNNVAMNDEFCLKVVGNEIYLRKRSNRKHKRSKRTFSSRSHRSKNIEEHDLDNENSFRNHHEPEYNHTDVENIDTTLDEMENFLDQLRSQRKVSGNEERELFVANPQSREVKFLARIQAKRKAKLMACVSEGLDNTEKEAKFLKALQNQNREITESSDIESRKQKLIEKIRAETDAIVLADKPGPKQSASNPEDDPLMDVRTFLNMIKEAESVNEETSKQVYVSFSLKRSDVKRLESLTSGKASNLSEESQRFLNNVRAKIRAKKAPPSSLSLLMQKPEI